MKSTKCDKGNTSELPYPKLMIDDVGVVVLMSKHGVGVVLNSSSVYHLLGTSGDNWYMNNFKDYSGTITLENSNDH